jgi:hypothetical protein
MSVLSEGAAPRLETYALYLPAGWPSSGDLDGPGNRLVHG